MRAGCTKRDGGEKRRRWRQVRVGQGKAERAEEMLFE